MRWLSTVANALNTDPKSALMELADAFNIPVSDLLPQQPQGQEPTGFEEPPDHYSQFDNRISALEKRQMEDAEKQAAKDQDELLERQIQEVSQKHPEVNWSEPLVKKLCWFASQPEAMGDLEKGFNLMKQDSETTIQNYIESKKNQGPSVEGGGGTPTQIGQPPKTLSEAKERADEYLKTLEQS